jgi:hypothetical protein
MKEQKIICQKVVLLHVWKIDLIPFDYIELHPFYFLFQLHHRSLTMKALLFLNFTFHKPRQFQLWYCTVVLLTQKLRVLLLSNKNKEW